MLVSPATFLLLFTELITIVDLQENNICLGLDEIDILESLEHDEQVDPTPCKTTDTNVIVITEFGGAKVWTELIRRRYSTIPIPYAIITILAALG